MVSMAGTQDILEALTGQKISCGSIANIHQECARKLEKPLEAVKEALREKKVACFDETGMRTEGRLEWLHTASTKALTYLALEQKRWNEGMDAIGILPAFKGIAIHDCLAAYWKYQCKHGLCNAHLLRNLKQSEEMSGQEWPVKMRELIIGLKKRVDALRITETNAQCVPPEEMATYYQEYDRLVEEGLRLNPAREKRVGKKGRVKQSPERLLLLRLKERREEYLLFANDFGVPVDNNQAERDFRMAKVKMKVSGSFRSEEGGEAFACIRSFMGTLTKNAQNVYSELVQLFKSANDYSWPFSITATE
jgi:transposase